MMGCVRLTVSQMEADGVLRVEDGNHGEYRPRRNEFVDGGTSFIRAADMSGGRVRFDGAAGINADALARIRKGVGKPGDVLLSHKGTVGKVAFAGSEAPPFVCSPQTTFWRSLDTRKLDRRYLYYYLQSPDFVRQLDSRRGETDMADYVSLTTQRTLEIQVPSIEIQQLVVAVLGALDTKIDVNQRLAATLESELHVSLRAYPSRELPFTEVAEVNATRRLEKGIDAPYLGMADVPVGGALVPRPRSRPYTSGARFVNGDTLMAKITPCLENGKTCFVDFLDTDAVGWGSTEFHVLTAKPGFPNALPYALARQEEVREHVIANMTGTSGRQRCPASAFDSLTVLIPPHEALQEWGALAEANLRTSRALLDESSTLAELRDALLPKLLSGEIRVREAEGELEEAGV